MMKKTIGMLLLLCLPLSMQAQLFNEDGYQITRMTNLSNEVSKVDSEGFSMCGLCFAHFDKGDMIEVLSQDGEAVARGVAKFDSETLKLVLRKKTAQVHELLGKDVADELIHKNDLVVF